MKNSEVAKAFGRNEIAKTKNVFVEMENDGLTIYSYGKHFPISKKTKEGIYLVNPRSYSNSTHFPISKKTKEGIYLVNPRSYSNSTAKHKNYVLGAIGEETILFMENCNKDNSATQYKDNLKEIETAKTKKEKAKTKKDYWQNRINELEEQNSLIIQYYNPIIETI